MPFDSTQMNMQSLRGLGGVQRWIRKSHLCNKSGNLPSSVTLPMWRRAGIHNGKQHPTSLLIQYRLREYSEGTLFSVLLESSCIQDSIYYSEALWEEKRVVSSCGCFWWTTHKFLWAHSHPTTAFTLEVKITWKGRVWKIKLYTQVTLFFMRDVASQHWLKLIFMFNYIWWHKG